ncbi:alpha-1,2-fucosyltransferase [Candidatus Gracilibacteria bacterium]|nr:alpha-1,2-fucosyltransferase [Candidatus Gracilibacteria bacterium]
MIIVKISGGLGNQLFQYAFGLFLENSSKEKVLFDVSFYKKNKERKLEIEILITDRKIEVGIFRKIFFKILNLYYQQENAFTFVDYEKVKSKKYLDGYWQNINYINPIETDLLKKISILNLNNSEIYSEKNSTSVHIRKADYVGNEDVNICDRTYFSKAMDLIKSKTGCKTFLIFSDDISEAKEMFLKNELKGCEIIFIEPQKENPARDMFSMSLCQNNIISNSTFSWWSAFLNNNDKKIVISPKVWNRKALNEINLIPKKYITL